MKHKSIKELIDAWTKIGFINSTDSNGPCKYCCFVSNGKLLKRKIHSVEFSTVFDTAQAICYKEQIYYIDIPMKPVNVNVEAEHLQA